eukprot:m51a1_g6133 hypothetical protein (311) ;mRNA; f:233588-234719
MLQRSDVSLHRLSAVPLSGCSVVLSESPRFPLAAVASALSHRVVLSDDVPTAARVAVSPEASPCPDGVVCVSVGPDLAVASLALSPDSRRLLAAVSSARAHGDTVVVFSVVPAFPAFPSKSRDVCDRASADIERYVQQLFDPVGDVPVLAAEWNPAREEVAVLRPSCLELYTYHLWAGAVSTRDVPVVASATGIAWSPSGEQLAVGTKTGTVVVVSAQNGDVVRTVECCSPLGPIRSLWWPQATVIVAAGFSRIPDDGEHLSRTLFLVKPEGESASGAIDLHSAVPSDNPCFAAHCLYIKHWWRPVPAVD